MKNIISIIRDSFWTSSHQLWRNKFLTLSTIFLGALIVLLLNFIFALRFFVDFSLADLQARADFSIPLKSDYKVFELKSLINELENNFSVELKTFAPQKFPEFTLPASLNIKFLELSEVGEVLTAVKKNRYQGVIGDFEASEESNFVALTEKLLAVYNSIEKIGWWLVLIFCVGGILLGLNTFRIILFTRKKEVFITRLLGATPAFIVAPFLWEGLLIGFFSASFGIATFVLILREIAILPSAEIFNYLWENVFFWEIFGAILIGVLGSWLALKRYLFGHFEN
jgi:cell division transport system permease protein